ncbi:hypothetical protein [Thermofilum sp.]|jgi:hypothetical protein|uniref:hypothetical protein n=1 Tax=Thermofilum sp. TaxID=1961369 RepID=UPI00258A111F|nr:hypothetical protein [Thermofilum sp.]
MTDVWDRLINAFFGFRNAKGHYAYEYGRYRDRVESENSSRSAWLLHGHKIAELKRTDNGLYVLWLTNAGYDTQTTISRLNLIVYEAYKRYMSNTHNAPLFRLKYYYLGSEPITTYVEHLGKSYLLTGREVKIVFFPEQGRADVDIYGREILFFKDTHEPEVDRKLQRIRRLRWEINSLLEKIAHVDGEAGKLVILEFKDTLELLEGAGLRYYGIFAEYVKEPEYSLIVSTLKNIRNTLKLIYNDDPDRMRASIKMVL